MSSYLVHYANAQHRANAERRTRDGRTHPAELMPEQRGRVWRRMLGR
jgi:hypothetical protein